VTPGCRGHHQRDAEIARARQNASTFRRIERHASGAEMSRKAPVRSSKVCAACSSGDRSTRITWTSDQQRNRTTAAATTAARQVNASSMFTLQYAAERSAPADEHEQVVTEDGGWGTRA
jgi:hypothetical protein